MLIKRMNLKTIVGVGAAVVVFVGIVHGTVTYHNSVEYTAPSATTTVQMVEVLPDWAEDEDAKAAAQAVLRKKELEQELDQLTLEREAIQARINEVEKELGTY